MSFTVKVATPLALVVALAGVIVEPPLPAVIETCLATHRVAVRILEGDRYG